jgi:hypothetical protein
VKYKLEIIRYSGDIFMNSKAGSKIHCDLIITVAQHYSMTNPWLRTSDTSVGY